MSLANRLRALGRRVTTFTYKSGAQRRQSISKLVGGVYKAQARAIVGGGAKNVQNPLRTAFVASALGAGGLGVARRGSSKVVPALQSAGRRFVQTFPLLPRAPLSTNALKGALGLSAIYGTGVGVYNINKAVASGRASDLIPSGKQIAFSLLAPYNVYTAVGGLASGEAVKGASKLGDFFGATANKFTDLFTTAKEYKTIDYAPIDPYRGWNVTPKIDFGNMTYPSISYPPINVTTGGDGGGGFGTSINLSSGGGGGLNELAILALLGGGVGGYLFGKRKRKKKRKKKRSKKYKKRRSR